MPLKKWASLGENRLETDEHQEFRFVHVKVEMLTRHLCGDAALAAGCVSMKLR